MHHVSVGAQAFPHQTPATQRGRIFGRIRTKGPNHAQTLATASVLSSEQAAAREAAGVQ